MSAAAILSLINYGFVLIFGIIVSFYFAGICWEDNKRLYILTIIAFAIFQTVSYITFGKEILYKCYPIFIHIPLILIIRYICHQNIYISSIAVMSAYLMCTPRKWFGTLAMYVFPQVHMISDITTIAVTIPLLLIVVKYISPYIMYITRIITYIPPYTMYITYMIYGTIFHIFRISCYPYS